MQIYLPIAEIPVNVFVILFLGLFTGFLAGMFGIGGGFLATPFLIFIGVPSAVAVSTSTNQIIAASISGLLAHFRRQNVDVKIGLFLVFGGFLGSIFGVSLFRFLQQKGQIDVVIGISYVLFLGIIGFTMFNDCVRAILEQKFAVASEKSEKPRFAKFMSHLDRLPGKIYFPRSDVFVSALVPIILSAGIGVLVALMGIGGGFLMIPAMIYILKMPSHLVVGTSLFQIVFIASNATFLQAATNNNVDIMLAVLMIISSAIGAQIGTRAGYKVDANITRLALAVMLLAICGKMLFSLIASPGNLYSLEILQ